MNITESGTQRWNIFAAVLEDMLQARGLGLGFLDDRPSEAEKRIHREKVRRLQRSLKVPKSFPVLTPDEIENVTVTFALSYKEKRRLQAAVLATSIEATLMDRITVDKALKAAQEVLSIIEDALCEYENDEDSGISAIKGVLSVMIDDTEMDRRFEAALDAIDRATIALHLSRTVELQGERTKYLRQAQDGFAFALERLDEADMVMKECKEWQVWYIEAEVGLQGVKERLGPATT